MKRVGVLLTRHRYLTLAAVGLLVAAGAVAAFSGAAFSYKTANPNNTFTAGILTHSGPAGAILTAANMKPGDTATGTATIANTGTIAGALSLAQSGLADTPGGNGGALSDVLQLTVEDVTAPGAPVVKYTGLLKDMPSTLLGTLAAGGSSTYEFTVTFPDGGEPSSNTTGDNRYQGSSLTVQFDWTSVQT